MPETIQTDAWTTIRKLDPVSRGRTDVRKRKPKRLAVIMPNCTGCAGSPACVEYCPVDQCMFWRPDEEHPPFGRIEVDKSLCIGCARCVSSGPDGIYLEACPWDAIQMVATTQWEQANGVILPDVPDRPPEEWMQVPEYYV